MAHFRAALEVQMRGQREELLEAVVDPARMESYGIGLAQVLDSVAANNRLIPAGAVDTGSGRFSVKVPSIIEEAKDLYDLPAKELKKIPTVCGSLREALMALDKDRKFLTAGGVFDDDQIDAYLELKMADVLRFEMTPHPVEFDMYYSV